MARLATGETTTRCPIKVAVGRIELQQILEGATADRDIPDFGEEGGADEEGDVVVSMVDHGELMKIAPDFEGIYTRRQH